MKNYLNIVFIVVLLVLIGTVISTIDENLKLKKENKRIESNFNQLNDENSYLTLKTDELRMLIRQGDRRLKKTDSILQARNIKISQLQKLKVNTVKIIDTDTVFLTNTDTFYVRTKKDTTLYKTPFKLAKNCIEIEGFVMSTDEFPSVAITSQNAEIETYEIEVKRRWYQFWKPKRWSETYTKCGDMRVLDIKKAGK